MTEHLVPLDEQWSLWRRFVVRGTGLPFETVAEFAVPELLEGRVTPEVTERASARTAAAMWSALADDTFMAALTWQNPSVTDTWAARLAASARAGEQPPITRRNERERVVSRYAQRYATKNESIGFFGPVAWGVFAETDQPLLWTGSLGPRRHTVSFEVWAIAELAAAWAKDPAVRPHLPVRLDPACSVRNGRLVRPRRPPVELDGPRGALLAALADHVPFSAVVAAAARTSELDELGLTGVLEELGSAGAVQIGFLVPFDEHPERRLRAQVAAIADDAVRDELTGRLDRMDAALATVQAGATDPGRLRPALQGLAEAVVAAGGRAGRSLSRHDLGRTAVYLDSRRDLDVELGSAPLDELRAPLGLLLRAADWVAAEVGDVVEEHLRARFRELRRSREVVTLAELQAAATEVLVPGNDIVARVPEDFQLRWAELVPAGGARPVRLRTAEIRALVEALFPARIPAWAAARHHTPDLMLFTEGGGCLRWVLGELHIALNTVESRLFATQCDEREDLVRATAADFASGRVVPVYPPDGVANNSRTYPPPALDPPGAFHYWSFASDNGHEHAACSEPATAVRVVEEEAEGALVGVAEGWRAPVMEFFGEFLTSLCVNMFTMRVPAPHLPRVFIDDVVVCRESWWSPARDVPLPRSRPDDHTYQELRRWAQAAGMPRHVFVRSPREVKPIYVDLAAPALVDNLARLVRAAAADGCGITVTEMLPGPDQLWLKDGAGRRFTTEFRTVAVRRSDARAVVRPND